MLQYLFQGINQANIMSNSHILPYPLYLRRDLYRSFEYRHIFQDLDTQVKIPFLLTEQQRRLPHHLAAIAMWELFSYFFLRHRGGFCD
jgi:hypothetical protein